MTARWQESSPRQGLTVRAVYSTVERGQVFRLRYRVFAETLKWIPENASRLDRDDYDAHATLLGVFGKDHALLGTIRIVFRPERFMLDKEFAELLPTGQTVQLARAELSRMCLVPAYQGSDQGRHMAMALLYHAYTLCIGRGIEAADFVSTPEFLNSLLARGLSCEVLSEVQQFGRGGATSVAARLLWSAFSVEETFSDWVTHQYSSTPKLSA